jgi:hypothetical protein
MAIRLYLMVSSHDLDLRRFCLRSSGSSCQVAEVVQSSERAELWNFPAQIHAKKAFHEFGEIFVCSLIFQLAIGQLLRLLA